MQETLKTTTQGISQILAPYHNRIVVDRDTPERFTASGFEIPGSFLPKKNTGIVLGTGQRVKEVSIGMYILFGRNSGTEITINDHTYLIMREEDAILEIGGTIRMFGNRLLIEPSEAPKMIKGIHIPDTVEEQPQTGIVRHVGRDCEEVVPGANVLYGKYAGMKITVQGKEYICVREQDVFANLDE